MPFKVMERVLRNVRETHVGWRQMLPTSGLSSPIRSLMAVDFPAPLAPITATREAMHTDKQIS